MIVDLRIKTTVFIVSLHYEYESLWVVKCLSDGRWAIICNLEEQIKPRKVKLFGFFSGITAAVYVFLFIHWLLFQFCITRGSTIIVRPIVTAVLFKCGRSFLLFLYLITCPSFTFWLGLQWGRLFADREWSLRVCWRVISWWMWVLCCFRLHLGKVSIRDFLGM